MSPKAVFALLVVLGSVWTVIWVWVLAGSGRTAPYAEVIPKVAVLRRRLFYVLLVVGVVALLVSLRWLPYAPVRVATLGPPRFSIEATASQWFWMVSPSEIPMGVPVEFRVVARDVNHSFALFDPSGQLVTQVQAMPGYSNRLIYVFERPGAYTVRCLEYCGIAHHAMMTTLSVK
jgi:cytochrome c oxidase subunit II